MKRFFWAPLLLTGLLLTGCGKPIDIETQPTAPAVTAPSAGDPHDVTCLDSYTGTDGENTIIARMEGAALTNEDLQSWYWAEVSQYRLRGASPAPDFDRPLDIQSCEIDDSVNSWQQYFLKTALNRWHTAQALLRHSQQTPLPLEEAYKGDPEKHAKYITGMPATKFLYGYEKCYRPNTLHQAYLDSLSEHWAGSVLDMARDLNYGYMYFTTLTYGLEESQSVTAEIYEPVVTVRHMLLLPREGESLGGCMLRAEELLSGWRKQRNSGESTFAQLASQNSLDDASASFGGLYENISREQMPDIFARWCFEEGRQEGDTTYITTEYGVHILCFVSGGNSAVMQAAQEGRKAQQGALLAQIRAQYPMTVEYSKILLTEAGDVPALSQLLYPDIAHERFPEVPLYLQQDYTGTMYGEYPITTNGCGITSLAMLASYMTDEELTPPELCARYGRNYSRPTGTAGSLFEDAPPQLGFYLIKKTYDWQEVWKYMEEGYPVVVCQHKGYWTSGGHYLVLEAVTEDGMVQVRDSNLYNYGKLRRHREDKFPWETIRSAAQGYWIFEKKAAAHPACTRCADPESLEMSFVTDYLCSRCRTALTRRETYLFQ